MSYRYAQSNIYFSLESYFNPMKVWLVPDRKDVASFQKEVFNLLFIFVWFFVYLLCVFLLTPKKRRKKWNLIFV